MSAQASFTLRGRNPDVLTCIANLSNDEVFTPPEFANRMLDTLTEAWAKDNGGANTETLVRRHLSTLRQVINAGFQSLSCSCASRGVSSKFQIFASCGP